MAGFDHEFTTGALFAAGAQAFMLGHIHRHQAWEQDGRWIAYAGSIGRFHYGEQGDKGYLLWAVGAATARCALVPTPARRTLDLVFEGTPDLERIAAAAQNGAVDGAYVRVRWCVAEEDRYTVDRRQIEATLAGACEVKLEGRIVPAVRARAGGISGAATLRDKLTLWATSVGTDIAPLLVRLESLQSQTCEQIAYGILAETSDLSPTYPTQQSHRGAECPSKTERSVASN